MKMFTRGRYLVVAVNNLAGGSSATQTLNVRSCHCTRRGVFVQLVVKSTVGLVATTGVVESVAERVRDDIVAVQTIFAGGASS